jgi:hypothetical protein
LFKFTNSVWDELENSLEGTNTNTDSVTNPPEETTASTATTTTTTTTAAALPRRHYLDTTEHEGLDLTPHRLSDTFKVKQYNYFTFSTYFLFPLP